VCEVALLVRAVALFVCAVAFLVCAVAAIEFMWALKVSHVVILLNGKYLGHVSALVKRKRSIIPAVLTVFKHSAPKPK
jgi:hypothetical protein